MGTVIFANLLEDIPPDETNFGPWDTKTQADLDSQELSAGTAGVAPPTPSPEEPATNASRQVRRTKTERAAGRYGGRRSPRRRSGYTKAAGVMLLLAAVGAIWSKRAAPDKTDGLAGTSDEHSDSVRSGSPTPQHPAMVEPSSWKRPRLASQVLSLAAYSMALYLLAMQAGPRAEPRPENIVTIWISAPSLLTLISLLPVASLPFVGLMLGRNRREHEKQEILQRVLDALRSDIFSKRKSPKASARDEHGRGGDRSAGSKERNKARTEEARESTGASGDEEARSGPTQQQPRRAEPREARELNEEALRGRAQSLFPGTEKGRAGSEAREQQAGTAEPQQPPPPDLRDQALRARLQSLFPGMKEGPAEARTTQALGSVEARESTGPVPAEEAGSEAARQKPRKAEPQEPRDLRDEALRERLQSFSPGVPQGRAEARAAAEQWRAEVQVPAEGRGSSSPGTAEEAGREARERKPGTAEPHPPRDLRDEGLRERLKSLFALHQGHAEAAAGPEYLDRRMDERPKQPQDEEEVRRQRLAALFQPPHLRQEIASASEELTSILSALNKTINNPV